MTASPSPRRGGAPREAQLLLGLAVLLTAAAWAVRTPRLPLRADARTYRLDLDFPVLAPAAALALYRAGEHLFIDLREGDPAVTPHIPGAFFVRDRTFADDLLAAHDFLGPQEKVVLCGDGNLLAAAAMAARLRDRGYGDISLLEGDLAAWRRAGGPVSGGGKGAHD
ncbi:MAG: rhodanese-like domain-containing protein [Candidatus Krumholzibacteriia bacterium]